MGMLLTVHRHSATRYLIRNYDGKVNDGSGRRKGHGNNLLSKIKVTGPSVNKTD